MKQNLILTLLGLFICSNTAFAGGLFEPPEPTCQAYVGDATDVAFCSGLRQSDCAANSDVCRWTSSKLSCRNINNPFSNPLEILTEDGNEEDAQVVFDCSGQSSPFTCEADSLAALCIWD